MDMMRAIVLAPRGALEGRESPFRAVGVEMEVVHSAGRLLEELRSSEWDATVVSLTDDAVDEALIARIAALPATGALFLTAAGASLEAALLAERVGALGVLAEPLEPEEVEERFSQLRGEGETVPLDPERSAQEGPLVGQSPAMAEVFGMIARVAPSASTVLITGESGTGKEVVARTLHEQSPRAAGPFVAVNCAAIPEHLLESELFGHEKGAFTGAVGQRKGRFQRAHGGTLFLDEIGDMSVVLQAKLLRALEERAVERVGGEVVEEVDVRVLAATNQDLEAAIEEGRFREDLYYRLGVVEIALPPLRDRGRDIRRLALHFAGHFATQHGRAIRGISARALARLEEAPFHGNVRELRNVMDRAVLLTPGEVIQAGALRLGPAAPRASARSAEGVPSGYPARTSLAEVEADHIRRVLDVTAWQVGKAADVLGIHRNTLSRKIQEYELERRADG